MSVGDSLELASEAQPDVVENVILHETKRKYLMPQKPTRLSGTSRTKRFVPNGARADKYGIFKRDKYRCKYCGRDGKSSFDSWLSLSVDHLLPRGHAKRDDLKFIVTCCGACNGFENRREYETRGKSPAELIREKRKVVLARRKHYQRYWAQKVSAC